jgi:hypothetical protein
MLDEMDQRANDIIGFVESDASGFIAPHIPIRSKEEQQEAVNWFEQALARLETAVGDSMSFYERTLRKGCPQHSMMLRARPASEVSL